MPVPEIRIFESLEELSRAVAARFREAAVAAPGNLFSVAVSGGSTPRRTFELLADAAAGVPWERVQIFQVDERCVPPDHPRSNYGMIREVLLSRVPGLEEHFHRMAGEQPNAERAAEDYAREIAEALRTGRGGSPRLDLILLGMGEDGHTASLFPGSPALEEKRRWVAPNSSPHVELSRLTLTYSVLNAAAEIIFMVAGADKAETLRTVLEGPARPRQLPAQGVEPAAGRVNWYIDRAAARLLTRPARSSA